MKLRVVLESPGQGSRDLVATIDSSATVGELATYLAQADPRRPVAGSVGQVGSVGSLDVAVDVAVDGPVDAGGPGQLTLALVDQNYRAVDARLTIPESGLRSGVTIAVTRRSRSVVDVGAPVAAALIVAGPDSGKEFPLWRGTAYIGRGHGAKIRLSDSSVSRRHAKLVVAGLPAVTQVVEVVDLGSANGISVGGVEVPRAVLKAGDRVRLGDTEIEVRLTDTAAVLNTHSADSPESASWTDSASVAFTRSPRIAPLFDGRQFDLPDLPERPKPSRMPWLAMTFPALMGMGLFAFTKSPASLIFVLMSPMMMLGNYIEQRRGGAKDFENMMRDFRQDLEILTTQIRESLEVEAEHRGRENPSSAECAEAARRLSPLLWTRRHDTPGFLQLRLPGDAAISKLADAAGGRPLHVSGLERAGRLDGGPVCRPRRPGGRRPAQHGCDGRVR